MTAKEQTISIWATFINKYIFPAETKLKEAIGKIKSLVLPQIEACQHVAALLLQSYADHGCPADCSPDWSVDHIIAAIEKGPHASALKPDAIEALHVEMPDKVKNGYAKIICFGDIMDKLPPKLKISLVAMNPHKSRAFRTIIVCPPHWQVLRFQSNEGHLLLLLYPY